MANNNLKNVWVLIALFLFVFSCKEKQKINNFDKFPKEYSLKAEVIPINEFYKHCNFNFYDTLVFFTNTPKNSNKIHIYNKNFNYISSSGASGRGPGELSNPFFASVDKKNGVLWFLDMGKKKIFKFPIDSILKNHTFLPSETEAVAVPDKIPILLQFYPEAKIFSCANYLSDTILISYFNKKGKVVDSLEITKADIINDLNSKAKRVPKVTFLYKKHPQKDMYAIVYTYADKVAIIDKNSHVVAISQGPDMIEQKIGANTSILMHTYADVQCDENYIYALYRGSKITGNDNRPVYAQKIHVFNWEGKPIARLNLDHPLATFGYQQSMKRFISFSQLTGEIVAYTLPDELK